MPEENTPLPPDEHHDLDAATDPFHPPSIPTLVGCLHCGEEYESYLIEWRIEEGQDGRRFGCWCCPITGCDGRGFGFDLLPVDPEWTDPDGRDMGWCEDPPPPEPHESEDRPPPTPVEVRCECCGATYMSDRMWWWVDEEAMEDPGAFVMYGWRCPTPECWGMGFGDGIRPTDPGYEDPDGRRILRSGETWEQWRKAHGEPDRPIGDDDIPF